MKQAPSPPRGRQIPLSPSAAMQQARAAYTGGNWTAAEQLCLQILKANSSNVEALTLLGTISAQTGRWSVAAELFGKAIAANPGDANCHGNLGHALSGLNRFDDALGSYERALKIRPDFAEIHFSRGNALRELGRLDDALDGYDRSISIRPDFAEAHNNRGIALHDLKRFDAALASYDQALTIRPDYAEVCYNRAIALRELGRLDDALNSYDNAIMIRPDYAEAFNNRGIALCDLQRFEEALESCERALSIDPGYAEAWTIRGIALNGLKRPHDALPSHDRAIQIRPESAEAHTQRGVALHDLKRFADALESYDRALRIRPDHAEAHNNRGTTLQDLKRFNEALESYERAVKIKPDFAEAHTNRGTALQDLNRFDDALESYDCALRVKPGHAAAHYNEGLCRLSLGQFDRGWDKYRWRWQNEATRALIGNPRHQSIRRHEHGSAPGAGALLIWGEAGIGDRILFCSMLPEARALSAQIIVETDERLVPLLQRAFPDISFIPPLDTAEIMRLFPAIQSQIPAGDLGSFVRRSQQDFPHRTSYIRADPQRAGQIRRINDVDASATVIGLAWNSANPRFGADKSLPLIDLQPLLQSFEDVILVSLQYGKHEQDINDFTATTGRKIVSLQGIDLFSSMEDLAAAVSICNRVVTCSNVTAHMACALGVDTSILLSRSTGCIWYWGAGGDRTPWYPTARLFRQHAEGDWRGAIEDVRHAGLTGDAQL